MSKNGVRKNVLGGVHTARLLKYVGPIFQHCACSYPNYLTLCLTLIVINTVSSTATRKLVWSCFFFFHYISNTMFPFKVFANYFT